MRDDGLVHVPPHFNDFVPPGKGNSYFDPQYGCAILRLTDAVNEFHLSVHHQYSTINAMNQDDTRIMLTTEWGQSTIIDTAGNMIIAPADFPAANTANLPWSRGSAGSFYYADGNTLFRGEISGHNIKRSVVHRFDTYKIVTIPDQEDLSEDGDHLWLVAGTETFLYTISTGETGPAMQIGAKDTGCSWHKIQIMPSNKALVTWSCNGPGPGGGQEIYNSDGTLNWHMFNSSVHTDVGRDLEGNEVAIVGRVPDTYKDACPSRGGVNSITTSPPHRTFCLVDVNWADTHISYRDSPQGWVAISFFDRAACPHYSCFAPEDLEPDWASAWRHFYEEVILAKIDGSKIFRLAHHRSRSAESYWAQSRAVISRDGRYVIFDSNMNLSHSGLKEYSDVYEIKLR